MLASLPWSWQSYRFSLSYQLKNTNLVFLGI
jgi:hypothetical protein